VFHMWVFTCVFFVRVESNLVYFIGTLNFNHYKFVSYGKPGLLATLIR
jgi:hypothetical protein